MMMMIMTMMILDWTEADVKMYMPVSTVQTLFTQQINMATLSCSSEQMTTEWPPDMSGGRAHSFSTSNGAGNGTAVRSIMDTLITGAWCFKWISFAANIYVHRVTIQWYCTAGSYIDSRINGIFAMLGHVLRHENFLRNSREEKIMGTATWIRKRMKLLKDIMDRGDYGQMKNLISNRPRYEQDSKSEGMLETCWKQQKTKEVFSYRGDTIEIYKILHGKSTANFGGIDCYCYHKETFHLD